MRPMAGEERKSRWGPRGCALRRAGSSEDVIQKIVLPNIGGAVMQHHPEADEMGYRFAVSMIREYQPDLLMFHPANIDGMRHKYGLFNDQVTKALEDTDRNVAVQEAHPVEEERARILNALADRIQ